MIGHPGHLVRRFLASLSRRPPPREDRLWAEGHFTDGERALWHSMPTVDQRHSIEVAKRFVALRPSATRDEVAGALLHDIGKVEAGLGTVGRVVATVVGPRTRRFQSYHDHEPLGATMAEAAGSSPVTVELIRGAGAAADDLQQADDSI